MPDMGKDYRYEWYKKNKEKHLNYCKEKFKCECGKQVARSNASKHINTDYHKKKVENIDKDKDKIRDEIWKEIVNINASLKDLTYQVPKLIEGEKDQFFN